MTTFQFAFAPNSTREWNDDASRGRGRGRGSPAARRASSASGSASGSGLTNRNGPQVSTLAGSERPARPARSPARGPSAALRAASRRARTSTRGSGTGSSRACRSPRSGPPRGGGRRSGSARSSPSAVARDEQRDAAGVGREVRARLGDLVGASAVLPGAREDRSRVPGGASPRRCTRRTGGCARPRRSTRGRCYAPRALDPKVDAASSR